MLTRTTRLAVVSLTVLACLGCSAGARVSLFDKDEPQARTVRFEERHCHDDECTLHHEGKVISGSMDVDIDD